MTMIDKKLEKMFKGSVKELPDAEQVRLNKILPELDRERYIRYMGKWYPVSKSTLPASMFIEEYTDDYARSIAVLKFVTGYENPSPTVGDMSILTETLIALFTEEGDNKNPLPPTNE